MNGQTQWSIEECTHFLTTLDDKRIHDNYIYFVKILRSNKKIKLNEEKLNIGNLYTVERKRMSEKSDEINIDI